LLLVLLGSVPTGTCIAMSAELSIRGADAGCVSGPESAGWASVGRGRCGNGVSCNNSVSTDFQELKPQRSYTCLNYLAHTPEN
jgi:hypothetical protein